MGFEEMDLQANEPEASYKIITLSAAKLPEQYRNLIFSKFLRSLRYGNDYFKLMASSSYFSNYHQYIELLLKRSDVKLKLAVLSDDEDVVLGWAMLQPGVIHYVYVNKEQRNQGIAKSLCANWPFDSVTHLTTIGARIFAKMKNVTFDPWK